MKGETITANPRKIAKIELILSNQLDQSSA